MALYLERGAWAGREAQEALRLTPTTINNNKKVETGAEVQRHRGQPAGTPQPTSQGSGFALLPNMVMGGIITKFSLASRG
jgi:hypothetical protein